VKRRLSFPSFPKLYLDFRTLFLGQATAVSHGNIYRSSARAIGRHQNTTSFGDLSQAALCHNVRSRYFIGTLVTSSSLSRAHGPLLLTLNLDLYEMRHPIWGAAFGVTNHVMSVPAVHPLQLAVPLHTDLAKRLVFPASFNETKMPRWLKTVKRITVSRSQHFSATEL